MRMADERGQARDDARLIGLFLKGDAGAFEELVERHVRLAGAVAYSITGDFHAAKDVVQEAWVKVHGSLGDLQDRKAFRAWLRNVVRTIALDWRRRNKRGQGSLEAVDEDVEPGAVQAIEDQLERDELRQRVREEIDKLPESHREVVALKYLEGLSYEEIGAITGLSVATIESRLWRARNTLRARFERVLEAGEKVAPED